jgi:Integrase core domain
VLDSRLSGTLIAAWATRAVARTELFEYLEVFYNGQRRHSALGYLSPRALSDGWITKHRQLDPSVYEIRGKSRLRVGRLA